MGAQEAAAGWDVAGWGGATVPVMRTRSRRASGWLAGAAACAALSLALSGCTGRPDTDATSAPGPTDGSEVSPTAPPASPDPSPDGTGSPVGASDALSPGDPCDPADGDPDCTDATSDETFRYVVGYADCVAEWAAAGTDEAYGLCTDLDGDGTSGYADSH